MCPSFRVTRDEAHVTRGRANTLRLAISGQLGADALGSDDLLALADDPRLSALPVGNVDVDDLLERSMLPLVVPAGSVANGAKSTPLAERSRA